MLKLRFFFVFVFAVTLPSVTDDGYCTESAHDQVGLIGDSQIGKTSLMVKYVEGRLDEDYIETLGVNFMVRVFALCSKRRRPVSVRSFVMDWSFALCIELIRPRRRRTLN
jgi:hypothetical protein